MERGRRHDAQPSYAPHMMNMNPNAPQPQHCVQTSTGQLPYIYSPHDQYSQPNQGQAQAVPGVFVVNQSPIINERFPISYKAGSVLIVSVLKFIVGFIQFAVGIAEIFSVPYFTSYVAFPVWCGILFCINGCIGFCTYRSQTKCKIGSFLGLSVISLFMSLIMLGFYSAALAYFNDAWNFRYYTCDYYGYCYYVYYASYYARDAGLGLNGFMVFLIVFELCLSFSAIVFSCKAYSKCCNTCNLRDYCTCVGCCECDGGTAPYTRYQENEQNSSPCSVLNNIIISFPGACRAFNVASLPSNDTGSNTVHVTFESEDADRLPNGASTEQANVVPHQISQAHPYAGAAAVGHEFMEQGHQPLVHSSQQSPPAYSCK